MGYRPLLRYLCRVFPLAESLRRSFKFIIPVLFAGLRIRELVSRKGAERSVTIFCGDERFV